MNDKILLIKFFNINVFDFVHLTKKSDKIESRSEDKIHLALLEKFLATSPYRKKTVTSMLCTNPASNEITDLLNRILELVSQH